MIVNILFIVSRTRERSCPRVNEFSAKSYFGYEAAMSRAIVDAAALYCGLRLIRKRGALLLPPKTSFCDLKETTIQWLAKVFPSWMYCRTGPGGIRATCNGKVRLNVGTSKHSPTES